MADPITIMAVGSMAATAGGAIISASVPKRQVKPTLPLTATKPVWPYLTNRSTNRMPLGYAGRRAKAQVEG